MRSFSHSSLVFTMFFLFCLVRAGPLAQSNRRGQDVGGVPAQQEVPPAVGTVKSASCGAWEFYGSYVGDKLKATSEEDCAAKCDKVKACDVYRFERNLKRGGKNCDLLNSKKKEALPLKSWANDVFCSRKGYKGKEPPKPEGSCGQRELYGISIQTLKTVDSVSECSDACNRSPRCDYSLFSLSLKGERFCDLFMMKKGAEELSYFAHESACPRTMSKPQ